MLSVMSGSYCWDWRRDETSFSGSYYLLSLFKTYICRRLTVPTLPGRRRLVVYFWNNQQKKIQLFFAFILSVLLCRQFWNENLRENDDDSTRTKLDERTRWSLWSVRVCFVWNCRDFISIKPSSTWLTQIKIHREQDSKIQRKFMRFFKGFGLHSSRVWCLLECVNRICGKHFFGWFLFDRCPLCVVLSFWCISKEMRNLVTWQFTTFYSKKKILSDCRIDASQNGISLFFPSSTGLGPILQRWHVMRTKAWKI